MKVANTLSGRKEEFVPQGDTVKIYVCGVTPYAACHIGHAMSYIFFDVIRRYLEFRGYKVKYVQNFTDIDDKIIDRAQKAGMSPSELAEKFISQYFVDMDALNIRRATIYPRATEEIPMIQELIRELIAKEHAYVVKGNVYFRVRSDADYGKLSHQSIDTLLAGARIEPGEGKEHPLDFALWKAAKPGEPSWESPWGGGRPGWHIECSAMSMRYLGATLDIHGGGQDLIFPHHENEIAQSESFTGKEPFVRYWLHNGLMQLGTEKMSKSLGNLVTIKEVLAKFSPDAVRLFVLSSHYRSPLTYSEEALEAMEKGLERLRQAAKREMVIPDAWASKSWEPKALAVELGIYPKKLRELLRKNYPRPLKLWHKRWVISPEMAVEVAKHYKGERTKKERVILEEYRRKFGQAMDDDFNTAQAVATLFDLAREINRAGEEGVDVQQAQQTFRELTAALGLTLEEKKMQLSAEPFLELLISVRDELRQNHMWQLADKIRAALGEQGIILEDTPQGTIWKQRS